MEKVRTHQQYLARMNVLHPTVRVLGIYIKSNIKILLQCTVCNNQWSAIPNASLRGQGCNKSCRSQKISLKQRNSHEEFVHKLSKLNSDIEVLGHYARNKIPLEVKCKVCTYRWFSRPDNLLSGYGCKECARHKASTRYTLNHETFLKKVASANPNLEIISQYIAAKSPISFHCHKCHTLNQTAGAFTVSKGRGCYNCGREKTLSSKRLTHEEFQRRLKDIHPNISVIGQYQISNKKIEVCCDQCGFFWEPLASNLLSGHGCPKCIKYGFSIAKSAYFYLIQIFYHKEIYWGFGITNNVNTRINRHKYHVFKKGGTLGTCLDFFFKSGVDALNLERTIKNSTIPTTGILPINGFVTEAFLDKHLSDVSLLIKSSGYIAKSGIQSSVP